MITHSKATLSLLLVVAMIAGLASVASAQTGVTISGVVSIDGTPRRNALITETVGNLSTTTNGAGQYILFLDSAATSDFDLSVFAPSNNSFPEVDHFVGGVDASATNTVNVNIANNLVQLTVNVMDEAGNPIDRASVTVFGSQSSTNVFGGETSTRWSNGGSTRDGTITLPVLEVFGPGGQDPAGGNLVSVLLNDRFGSAEVAAGTTEVTVTIPNADPPRFCNGQLVTVDLDAGEVPTNGDDVIRGTFGDDVIDAGAGRDVICGRGGDDIIDAGAGRDTVLGGSGNDTILGGQGMDALFGQGGNDILNGGKDADLVDGGADADTLIGGNGGDDLLGGQGADELSGGKGQDTLIGGRGADDLGGGGGTDTLDGGRGQDEYNGGGGTDTCAPDPQDRLETTANCEG